MHRIAADEQRHIALGVRLLYDLAREDPDVPAAVADLLREAIPYSTAVFVPPGWDRRYVEVFDATVEGVFEDATRSLDARLRAAGLAPDTLPGPPFVPVDLPVPERAARGIRLLEAGYLGAGEQPAATDPASVALLMDTVRRAVDARRAPAKPLVLQWAFADAAPWHVHVAGEGARAEPGTAPDPDVTFHCRVEDWAAVVARRAAPHEQLLRGRIRPAGSPRALWAARRLFG
jgi:hypothetical protein